MTTSHPEAGGPLRLRAGEEVEVRSREEILATLDEQGRLDGLPFMPEMLAACGRRFRVGKRAHKGCDTIHKTGNRRMHAAVHLEGVRCDGSAHGGCQASCLLYWKEAWLKRVGPEAPRGEPLAQARCSEAALQAATTLGPDPADGKQRWSCQATRLFEATTPLRWWDVRQYVEDVTSGNFRAREIIGGLLFRLVTNLMQVKGYRFWLWLYNSVQRLRGGLPYPLVEGRLRRTPNVELGIREGQRVRVRPLEAINATLDEKLMNRGLLYGPEMTPYGGGTYRVARRVERILDERTGKMIALRNCLILDGVYCRSLYSGRRIGCPRAILPYWREQWLEPLEDEDKPA
jgi:hypothetical protein